MEVTAVCFGCLLLAQFGAASEPMPLSRGPDASATLQPIVMPDEGIRPSPPERGMTRQPIADASAVPSDSSKPGRNRADAAQLVADAMTLPANSRLTGQPVTLVQAIPPTTDRRRQLEVVRALGDWRRPWPTLASVRIMPNKLRNCRRVTAPQAFGQPA